MADDRNFSELIKQDAWERILFLHLKDEIPIEDLREFLKPRGPFSRNDNIKAFVDNLFEDLNSKTNRCDLFRTKVGPARVKVVQ